VIRRGLDAHLERVRIQQVAANRDPKARSEALEPYARHVDDDPQAAPKPPSCTTARRSG
jgi:hypothetical protein